jgi:hypothetical protein
MLLLQQNSILRKEDHRCDIKMQLVQVRGQEKTGAKDIIPQANKLGSEGSTELCASMQPPSILHCGPGRVGRNSEVALGIRPLRAGREQSITPCRTIVAGLSAMVWSRGGFEVAAARMAHELGDRHLDVKTLRVSIHT